MSEPIPVWYTDELKNQRDDHIRPLRRIEGQLLQAGALNQRTLLTRDECRAIKSMFQQTHHLLSEKDVATLRSLLNVDTLGGVGKMTPNRDSEVAFALAALRGVDP